MHKLLHDVFLVQSLLLAHLDYDDAICNWSHTVSALCSAMLKLVHGFVLLKVCCLLS